MGKTSLGILFKISINFAATSLLTPHFNHRGFLLKTHRIGALLKTKEWNSIDGKVSHSSFDLSVPLKTEAVLPPLLPPLVENKKLKCGGQAMRTTGVSVRSRVPVNRMQSEGGSSKLFKFLSYTLGEIWIIALFRLFSACKRSQWLIETKGPSPVWWMWSEAELKS